MFPQRVLIYRNGASDGEFDSIRDREVIAMRKGLREILKRTKGDGFECPLSCQSGSGLGKIIVKLIFQFIFTQLIIALIRN